jgi:hypothetical protein
MDWKCVLPTSGMLTCKPLPLVWITIFCGLEFGVENDGKEAFIHRALCGGTSAGRDVNHLRSCMHHIGFKSCPADPDVWMRAVIKSDETEVNEDVPLYTDDAPSIGVEAESILRKEIDNYFLIQG